MVLAVFLWKFEQTTHDFHKENYIHHITDDGSYTFYYLIVNKVDGYSLLRLNVTELRGSTCLLLLHSIMMRVGWVVVWMVYYISKVDMIARKKIIIKKFFIREFAIFFPETDNANMTR